jgi:hypothetical protein
MSNIEQLKDPRRMAAEAVREYFQRMVTDCEAFNPDFSDSRVIDEAFEQIEDVIEAAFVKERGKSLRPDEDLYPRQFSREAGYLIGVQVGLRLREVK